jgi:hypothetical protein
MERGTGRQTLDMAAPTLVYAGPQAGFVLARVGRRDQGAFKTLKTMTLSPESW